MAQTFKTFISDEIVQEKMRAKYGKKYKLKMDMSYQYQYKSTKIDIGFTADKKAFWIFKWKGDYYMNIIDEITLKDKYRVVDIYVTLAENAVESLNHIVEMEKLKRSYKKKKK